MYPQQPALATHPNHPHPKQCTHTSAVQILLVHRSANILGHTRCQCTPTNLRACSTAAPTKQYSTVLSSKLNRNDKSAAGNEGICSLPCSTISITTQAQQAWHHCRLQCAMWLQGLQTTATLDPRQWCNQTSLLLRRTLNQSSSETNRIVCTTS